MFYNYPNLVDYELFESLYEEIENTDTNEDTEEEEN